MKRVNFLLIVLCLLSASCRNETRSVRFQDDQNEPMVAFAMEHLRTSLRNKGIQVVQQSDDEFKSSTKIIFVNTSSEADTLLKGLSLEKIKKEGFAIRIVKESEQTLIYVLGGDAAGMMYGGLELAEQIAINGLEGVEAADQKPYMNMRGMKFNIPLDVRTPSYSDVSDAAQNNMIEMWNFDFWKDCIDNLAKNRYNFMSLWNLHPFPSMIKVPDYREVALDDVKRSTVSWKEYYSGYGVGLDTSEIMDSLEIIKKISIEEKIAFWQKVMKYGKDRNVDFYFVTWNIFTYGTNGKYGITDRVDNPITIDYFRKSVKQMFVTYPDLAGIGLTTGENMPGLATDIKENWAFETYGKGMLDAAKEFPGRKMRLLHRQHQTGAMNIAKRFQPLIDHPDIDFVFSFKYAKAHVHSSTKQPYHQKYVKDIRDMKTIWTLRNDDTFYFRWGAPDFVREFIKNIPYEVSEGWYLGSDQWIWGREFLSKRPKSPREIELSKHWYQWMLWGRLGYNPEITNDRFRDMLKVTYPEANAEKLFKAWQEASMIYPKTTGFHWGMFDFQWYIEGCKGHPDFTRTKTGFHDVNRFINLPSHKSTSYLSIPRYVEMIVSHEKNDSISPLDLAEQIHTHADASVAIFSDLKPGINDDLRRTIHDILTVSAMGRYYAFKIEGATYLALFRRTNKRNYQVLAIERLNRAAEQWRFYVSLALTSYKNPLWTNRVGHMNWRALMSDVLKDVVIAGGKPMLNSMSDTPGGTIFLPKKQSHTHTWDIEVKNSGVYYAEIKYTCESGIHAAQLKTNKIANEFILWPTGGLETKGWDRAVVNLNVGRNVITLELPENDKIVIEHLNLLRID